MSQEQPLSLDAGKLQVLPDPTPDQPAAAEQPTIGWHLHRWTAWRDGKLTTTGLLGGVYREDAQSRRCTRCGKLKFRRVKISG